MELSDYLADMQQTFLRVYQAAYDQQVASGAMITPEVVIKLSDGQLYAVDMLRRENEAINVVELSKEMAVPSPAFSGTYRAMAINFAPAGWDALTLTPQACVAQPNGIEEWTVRWMDVEAQHRLPEAAPFGGVIHMIRAVGPAYDIDFGSAPPEAFLAFMDILAEAGCTGVGIVPTPLASPAGGA
jgi:hypothetical protein